MCLPSDALLQHLPSYLGFSYLGRGVISSLLFQQSTATAPYLGRGISSHGHPSWPWTWSSSSRPSCAHLNQIPYDYTVEVRNRFKGLDLIDGVPNELWMEVHDIVQETGIKTIPMEKKCKTAKWLSEESLQISVKRREAKSKGEKERYSNLNAKFQRIARRDK